MIGIAQARPPYVEFVQIAKHDPIRSEELGYRVTKDVDFARVMQPGSKDCLEIKAEDWLAQIKRKVIDAAHDAYPAEWVDSFHAKYKAWKDGQEGPLNGTSVKEWPILSPAQAQNFIALHILTIEDVAAMTEDAMNRYGMGSRELRDKAREWIKARDGVKGVEAEKEELKERIALLEEQLGKVLALQGGEAAAAKPKRRRKSAELKQAA